MKFIDTHFVDHVKGGWYALLTKEREPVSECKQSAFICPYHNARMCFEVIERYRAHAAE
jgi:mannobiose 2-epimerase